MNHQRLAIILAVGLLCLSTVLNIFPATGQALAATITVNGSGGADYLTITEALDSAQSGDNILVSPGTYNEYLTIEQSLMLHSTGGSSTTTISGPASNEDVLTVESANVSLEGFTITGGYTGLVVEANAESFQLTDVVIEETGTHPVSIAANLVASTVPHLTLVPHASNQFDAVLISTGTIEESTTLPILPAGFVYYLHSSTVTISGVAGPVLTIPTGTIVKSWFSRFEIGSASQPGGLMADNVIFTSIMDDTGGDSNGFPSSPSPGNWQRLDFNAAARNDSSQITNCQFSYGGSGTGVIEINQCDPLVNGNTFHNNATDLHIKSTPSQGLNQTGNTLNQGDGLPVWTNLDHLQNLVFGNTLVPRGDDRWNGIGIFSSEVSSSFTLPVLPNNFVYYLSNSIITVAGATNPVLSIPDETIIKSWFSRFEIGSGALGGGLMANNVLFTSTQDDEGGDTNGTTASPSSANWQRLDFNASARPDSCQLTNSTIRYAGAGTGAVEINGSDPLIQGNTFSHNITDLHIKNTTSLGTNQTGNFIIQGDGLPLATTTDHLENLLFGNSLTPRGDDKHNGILLFSSEVAHSWTLPVLPYDFVYILSSTTITVAGESSPVLAIPAGTIIKSWFSRFEIGSGALGGGLMADGVLFTSTQDDEGGDTNGSTASPNPGNWQRLDFNAAARNDSSKVINCTFRYGGAGTAAIEINDCDPIISGNQFLDNIGDLQVKDSPSLGANQTGNTIIQGNGFPIRTTLDHLQQLVFNNEITVRGDDKWNAISIFNSEITESWTLPLLPDGLVYNLNSTTITVAGESAPVLTILPGTIIKSWFSRFQIGTSTLPGGLLASDVVFTSTQDDIGGDTNGSISGPNPGNWQRLEFGPKALAISQLDNCEIRYGGNPAVEANGSHVGLINCLIQDSSGAAVLTHYEGANPSLVQCTLTNNGGGIRAEDDGYALLVRCCIEGNTDYGLQAPDLAGPQGSFMAVDCWWGSSNGPSGVGPGDGDSISGDVVFSPWYTTEACYDFTPVPNDISKLPAKVTVYGAAPNPFNPNTSIAFALPSDLAVQLRIYSVDGSLVKTLIQETLSAGQHEVRWHGQDEGGRSVATGLYFYSLEAGNQQVVDKLMLLK